MVKNPHANAATWVRSLVWEDCTCHGATNKLESLEHMLGGEGAQTQQLEKALSSNSQHSQK